MASEPNRVDIQRLIDLSPAVHYIAETTGAYRATFISDGIRSQLGYVPEQFTQDSEFWGNHIHPDDRSRVFASLDALSKDGPQVIEYRFQHADGSWRWMHDEVALAPGENGHSHEFLGSWLDITERKRAEEALREAHKKLEEGTKELRLIESRLNEAQRIAKIGSWELDLETNELWWSEEWYRIAGRDPDTFIPTRNSFLEIVHAEDRQRIFQVRENAANTPEPFSAEFRIMLPDGSVKNMHSSGEVVCDQEGRPIRMVGNAQDITERVALEREVVTAGEYERNRLGRELHDDLGQELATISYGLTSLSRELEREQSPHTKSVQDLARMTQESIEASQRLALAFSPELSSRLGFKAALMALVANVNRYSNVTCHAHCSDEDDDPYDLEAATHLYRIAQEAISNALKHSGAQTIDLYYGRDEDSIFLEVLDDGTGIPAKESRREGMGLRNMHYRARILRGRLDVASGTNGGTRVLCSCPAQHH